MATNVMTSWGSHFIFIISGFVIPRLIDGQLGQEALGIWDFCWSLVAYFALVQGGIVSSVNRYVARHWAERDIEGINRVTSSVTAVLLIMAAAVVGLSALFAWQAPVWFAERLGEYQSQTRWLLLFLGLSFAVQVAYAAYAGVLTGCHRWDLHNGINAGVYIFTLGGLITALVMDAGLPALGAINLGGEIIGRVTRSIAAGRICPGLAIKPWRAEWNTATKMLRFGLKTFVPQISELLMNQTVSVLVLAYMGPASLALFARPRALVRHARTLLQKYAFVLTPTASSLKAMKDEAQLRELFLTATRLGAYIAMPMIAVLVVMGDIVLRIWMGPDYALGRLLAILAIGHTAYLLQQPVLSVLSGLNAHGWPGVINAVAACISAALVGVSLGFFEGGLIEVAISLTIPITIANGIIVPVYACKRLHIPVMRYFLQVLPGPTLCAAVFAAVLLLSRILLDGNDALCLGTGLLAGSMVIGLLYWRFVLPASMKDRLRQRLGGAPQSSVPANR